MVRIERLDVVFLMETLVEESNLEQIRVKLCYDNKLVCSRDGHSGGLALFWKKNFPLTINNYSKNHIDATIQCPKKGRWRLTGFYGHPETCKRQESWEFLRHLCRDLDEPWVCLGDFNEILSIDEKWGGCQRPERQIQQFRDALDDCGLMDLGYRGPKFTWFKRNGDGEGIFERLDRGVANPAWINNFHEGYIQHLTAASSDHRPIILRTKNRDKRRNRPFRIESM